MNNHIRSFPAAFRFLCSLTAMLAALCAANPLPVHADSVLLQARQAILVPGTVEVTKPMQEAVVRALQEATELPTAAKYFAITDVRQEGKWALVSVAGLARVHAGQSWNLENDSAWTGLVLAQRASTGKWTGGVQGTRGFSSLMGGVPGTLLSPKAKHDLAARRPASAESAPTGAAYTFPWKAGTSMLYGQHGVHDNGYASVVSGWKAVDMMSDGKTAAGHAENMLLAAEAGTISYRCVDSHNMAIHLGDFFYTHLSNNTANQTALVVGATFAQSAELGPLRTGNFNGPCGWADQPSGWFHVHWGFPNASLQVEDWTLNVSTQKWSNGTTTITPGNGWIMAGGTRPCPAPVLTAPADGTVSTSQTVALSWQPISGCAFNGYMLRVKTVPTMDSDGITMVDTVRYQSSVTQTISSDWNKQDLYWGVKAANAPFGASWTVGRFRIDPGNAVPSDYGYCVDEGQRCAFSGLALLYYGANDHFIGPLPFTDGVECNSSVFGDPGSGATNQCFMRGGRPEGSTWCMNQGGTCSVGASNVATVYYGVNGQYLSQTNVIDTVACTTTAFGGDPFPALAKSCYYVVTGEATPVTQTFVSDAAQDGWVLEAGPTSNTGGSANSTGPYLRLGDDLRNRQYRAIMSFPTDELPDNARIISVTVKIKKASLTGGDPFGSLGNIVGDIKKGAIGGDPALQTDDWQASSQLGALTIPNAPSGGWYSGKLNSGYFASVNRAGITQIRLRFGTGDNGNLTSDFLMFYSGNYAAAPANRPMLVITYYALN